MLIKEEKSLAVNYEFEISGDNFTELQWKDLVMLKPKNHEVAIAIEKTLMKKMWEIVSTEEVKKSLQKNLKFLDLVKIKLDFGEYKQESKGNSIFYVGNRISLTDKLFGWVYYNDENEILETFRFTLNINNGEIKYFD